MSQGNHIVLLCTRLDLPGGIERAILQTAGLWASKGWQVTILVVDVTTAHFYPLPQGVDIVSRALHFGITDRGNPLTRKIAMVRHIYQLGQELNKQKPQFVIATQYELAVAAVSSRGKRDYKVFAWEHHHFHFLTKNRFWQWMINRSYPRLDGVVALNKTEQQLFSEIGCMTVVIPNFVEQQTILHSEERRKELLTIGWLIHRKGIDLIPATAKRVLTHFPDWHWRIVGEGPLEAQLLAHVHANGLHDRVIIEKPVSSAVTHLYQQASVFVLPSRFECFPMVLLEALANGLPCVAFDCPTGPADIIRQGEDGLLIEKENVEAMADGICQLIADAERRKKMGEKAQENILRFSPKEVYTLWEQLFHFGI